MSEMSREEKIHIIRGYVRNHNEWVPIGHKLRYMSEIKKRVQSGLVHFQGEWIPIDEKIARTTQPRSQQQTINYNTINRQVYNVDNRQIDQSSHQSHEHRHIHLSAQQAANAGAQYLHTVAPEQQLDHMRTQSFFKTQLNPDYKKLADGKNPQRLK